MESALIPKRIRLDVETNKTLNKTCQHYVKRKKRFCKMFVSSDKEYCGEHEPVANEIDSKNDSRIVCPLDQKHTVYKKNLEKHLKICNSRPTIDLPPYIKKNINDGSSEFDEETHSDILKYCHSTISISNISEDELLSLTSKIEKIYYQYVHGVIKDRVLNHEIMNEQLDQSNIGKEKIKHLSQISSLLGYLESFELFKNNTSFIEFGAGKGQVSYWLTKLIESRQNDLCNTNFVLIDRASLRHKKDNKVENRSTIHRIRADISDLLLENVELVKKMQHIVAVGKHLCGAATDITLRCLLHNKSSQNINFVISFCCHHRCTWKSFIGKEFLIANEISQKDFEIMIRIASWAVCGNGKSREKKTEIKSENTTREYNDNLSFHLSKRKKEEIGKMCKRVLDYARLEHMQNKGFDCFLYYYISNEITLENVCIIGKSRTTK